MDNTDLGLRKHHQNLFHGPFSHFVALLLLMVVDALGNIYSGTSRTLASLLLQGYLSSPSRSTFSMQMHKLHKAQAQCPHGRKLRREAFALLQLQQQMKMLWQLTPHQQNLQNRPTILRRTHGQMNRRLRSTRASSNGSLLVRVSCSSEGHFADWK